jgi:hypothetical protein
MAPNVCGSAAGAACNLMADDGSEWVPYRRSFAQKCAPAVASKTRSKGRSCPSCGSSEPAKRKVDDRTTGSSP